MKSGIAASSSSATGPAALNLVTAAIVLWNTVYLERAINALRGHGQPVDDALLQFLSPLGWEHINLIGGFRAQRILLANSILERISSEVVIERKSDVGVVDRLRVILILELWRIAMSLQPREMAPVPEETQRVARAAFPKDNGSVRRRDEIGTIFDDPLFAPWFPTRGRPAESPWRLALITVMQFVEGLSDRQAAEAVRARIDWKYALSLELTDPGGDASVLCEFRARRVAGAAGPVLLEAMLSRLKDLGLLKARGQQRTDSTPVLAAIRSLNRLESAGETLRAALNSVATVAPDGLSGIAAPEGFERYALRVEEYRLPKGEVARTALGEQIGTDGPTLLAAIYAPAAPGWLRELPAVQTLRQAWVHPFWVEDDVIRWRKAADLPPVSTHFGSSYDTDAHYSSKRSTTWTGYKVHVTETCDVDRSHLLVHVETPLRRSPTAI